MTVFFSHPKAFIYVTFSLISQYACMLIISSDLLVTMLAVNKLMLVVDIYIYNMLHQVLLLERLHTCKLVCHAFGNEVHLHYVLLSALNCAG